ncbi:YfbM family protein [Pedobacter sp. SYP-B3415]|uniref:YfbM family protein n=1 Tax=Pedobacter sp. SYP-B3415 TaxID=2496641 RepID=UPI001F116038|nr:YfbM family protein [Pedobacter sp. SYP-B3415]
MSMIGNLLRVTNAELNAYLEDSSLLENRIYHETDDSNLVDIDKTWEGIVFLLTGQRLTDADNPLLAVLFSGQLIDNDQDLGYGPAHYVTPEQVVQLNNEISKITKADLRQRFDPAKMIESGVYPNIWDESDETFEYLAGYFRVVQKIYSEAARKNEAIVTFIS